MTTFNVAATTVQLAATLGNTILFAPLTVNSPASSVLNVVTVTPTSVVGGTSATGTVTLAAATPVTAVVNLSDNSNAVTVPASVTVAVGTTSAHFTITTTAVAASTSAIITAVYGPVTQTAALTVTPASSGTLPAPSLVSPSADARFSPGQAIAFDWSDVTGASSYTIEIDDTDTFTAPLTVSQRGTASQYTNSTLPTRRLWWRVRANDTTGTAGAWSAVRRFEVK